MGVPPSSSGAFHEIDADVGLISFASRRVGGPGTPTDKFDFPT